MCWRVRGTSGTGSCTGSCWRRPNSRLDLAVVGGGVTGFLEGVPFFVAGFGRFVLGGQLVGCYLGP